MKIYEFDEFCVSRNERRLFRRSGENISLTPRVFDLLVALIESDGSVLTKDELLETVWADCIVEESNLSQSIFVLRKALGENAHNPRFIRTIPHQGYRFIAPVKSEITNGFEETPPVINFKADRTEEDRSKGGRERDRDFSVKDRSRGPYTQLRHKLKNRVILSLAALFVITIGISMAGSNYFKNAALPAGAIAVLPFENATNDGQIDFLTEGLAEDLTRSIGSLNKLPVISYQSARQMRKVHNTAELAGQLHAGSVLRGRFDVENDRLRVMVELTNLTNGTVLWTDHLSIGSGDLLKVRNALTTIITNQFQTLTESGKQLVLTDQGTRNNNAYLLYLQGKYGNDRATKEGLHLSIPPLMRAIEIDPNFALAYVALADDYNLLGTWFGETPDYFQPLARQTIEKALTIDESLSEAHTTLAKIRMDLDRDFSESEKEFRRAIEINPNNAQAHHWYGEVYLSAMGRLDESLRQLEMAKNLSPLSPNILTGLAWTYIGKKEYEGAVLECDKALAIDANYANAYSYKAIALMKLQKFDEAIAAAKKEETISGAKIDLAVLYGLSGETTKAKDILQRLENEVVNGDVSYYDLAVIHVAVGEHDKAFELLNKQAISKSVDLLSIRIDPLLDNIRGDPRFAGLETQLNLPPVSK